MGQSRFVTPTGRAEFPVILLAGVEGAGKTWAAVEATSMGSVANAFFVEIGEGTANSYGAVPGADFKIVKHDGSLGDIRAAIAEASAVPAAAGKFNLLIVDSLTELWDLCKDEAQVEANRRAARKGRKVGDEGAPISMDLWNRATGVWESIIRQLQGFPGPVISTARLEEVSVMADGHPTGQKEFKIQAHKKLPFRVQVIVQARRPREWVMTKIVTTVPELQLQPGQEMPFKDFSVEQLLLTMGITAETNTSTFTHARTSGALSDEAVAEEERAADLRSWADKLLSFEKAGDMEIIQAGADWAKREGDQEKYRMAASTLARMQKGAAPANAPGILDAQIVESGK